MIKKESVLTEIETIKDILCNKCGKSCLCSEDCGFSYASLSAHWGYGSNKDGQIHEAHLCEQCWDEITKTFKLSGLVAEHY